MELEVIRHSLSHVMAYAVKRIFKDVKFAIGPAISNGFYYDFDLTTGLTIDDLIKIEEEMHKIIKEDLPFIKKEISKKDALKLFADQPYKLELISELEGTISVYSLGEFTDLCKGPHVENTKNLKKAGFKLVSVNGAYFKGSEKNKMLQRIYAYAFASQKDLDDYINLLEEAQRRDHRKLGAELNLFKIMEEGPGFPFWLPGGMAIKNLLIDFWREKHKEFGYKEISTPIMLDKALWVRSGHWNHYRQNMYTSQIDEKDFAIKPMNCPGGILVYESKLHSYKDLPERIAELGLVHRHELSGALHGLMRVRCFTQDDAHIYMTKEQMEVEILNIMKLIDEIYKVFGFEYHIELSTRPENSMGTDEDWNLAIKTLKNVLDKNGKTYVINEGDGAFYGPKIDFHLKDSIGRTWQCGTIQLDFQLPERFELTYIGSDNQKHRPIMVHRVVLGSIERFIGILIEHYAGAFPFWISALQVGVVPVKPEFDAYANEIVNALRKEGIRAEANLSDDGMGAKVFNYKKYKVPYAVIVGARELENKTVSIKTRDGVQINGINLKDFINLCKKQNEEKTINLIDSI